MAGRKIPAPSSIAVCAIAQAARASISRHLYILPFSTTPVSVAEFPFTYFRVPPSDRNVPAVEIVYVEQVHHGDYLDGAADIAVYGGVWSGLLGSALDTARSHEFLLQAATQYEDSSSKET
ncbi:MULTISPECIES: Scr1 family TA system antitoxin-like transcriptional regulator [Actinoalloteichus]|uniref:Scr1 family TA system antitoxin-like transcriptional regulator n=1 Tax=Actinoalloteichus TaxID=65496 RepID=UPI0012F8F440|nr:MULTISPECIES: Scr1 family TA system antitoxin-like transcriptional regulator [Actinoalloteichus]